MQFRCESPINEQRRSAGEGLSIGDGAARCRHRSVAAELAQAGAAASASARRGAEHSAQAARAALCFEMPALMSKAVAVTTAKAASSYESAAGGVESVLQFSYRRGCLCRREARNCYDCVKQKRSRRFFCATARTVRCFGSARCRALSFWDKKHGGALLQRGQSFSGRSPAVPKKLWLFVPIFTTFCATFAPENATKNRTKSCQFLLQFCTRIMQKSCPTICVFCMQKYPQNVQKCIQNTLRAWAPTCCNAALHVRKLRVVLQSSNSGNDGGALAYIIALLTLAHAIGCFIDISPEHVRFRGRNRHVALSTSRAAGRRSFTWLCWSPKISQDPPDI